MCSLDCLSFPCCLVYCQCMRLPVMMALLMPARIWVKGDRRLKNSSWKQ